tara:strand:- start:65 stop:916 length:852 start_codon:yes stop_codon:yes gene_type:complete
MFFFFVNHYIYSIKNNKNFKIHNDNWLFKSELGWEDYFENIDITNKISDKIIFGNFNQTLSEYSIREYKEVLHNVYIYNKNTIKLIEDKKIKLNLKNNTYDSIFIRRGDKLIAESDYISAENYLIYLLELNPQCKNIYLQTDDYNCFTELNDYINKHSLDINLVTACEKNCKGMITLSLHKDSILNNNIIKKENVNYLTDNIKSLSKCKPVDKMDSKEIYNHTLEMLIGIDIVLKSNIVVTDYSSNVARFIKLKHSNSNNVYDIISKSNNIDYNKMICPSRGF